MKLKQILCAACVSLVGLQALAGEVDDNLKKLEAALQKSAKEQEKNATGSPENRERERMGYSAMIALPRLRECITSNNLNGATELLQQLSGLPLSEEARKAIGELQATLRKDQDARDKAVAAQIEQALNHAADAVKKAKTAADLDAVLQELASVKNSPESRRNSEQTQTARNKVESTYRFVARWQDYLAAQAAGNSENCRSILRDLANSDTLLIPRSELLAKAQEPGLPGADPKKPERSVEEIADEMIAKTKSLEELGNLTKELRRINRTVPAAAYTDLVSTIQDLERIDLKYREFQAGFSGDIDEIISCYKGSSFVALKTQLLLLVLPRYIIAPPGTKPKADEGVVEFLNRINEEAKARGDMALAIRARQVLGQMQRPSLWTSNDIEALGKFQAAQNQETAMQYMLAVISYQETLKCGSDAVSAKLIGERLADIKKKNTEDYEKGMERFLTLPQRQNPNRFPMGMLGRPEPVPTAVPKPEAPKLADPSSPPVPSASAATPASKPSPTK